MILDTSFIIDLQNSVADAVSKAEEIEEAGRPRRVPHVVLYELYIGVGKGIHTEDNRERLRDTLSALPTTSTTQSIAERAGVIEGELQVDDEGVGAVDAIVAATAVEHDEPVVTSDVSHFERVPGVNVETY